MTTKLFKILLSLAQPCDFNVGLKAQEERVRLILEVSFGQAPFKVNDLGRVEKTQFQRGVRCWLAEGMPIDGVPELYIPVNSFIYQPLGTQGFPDFLIRDEYGRFWSLEAKYSKTNLDSIVWNEGYPRHYDNALYVVSAPGITMVVCGSDLINLKMAEHIGEAKKGCDRECQEQAKHIREADESGMNFKCDNRIQIFSKSPLYHPQRKVWIARALEVVK